MSEPWLDDGDVRIYVGDALETLADMPDGSVDCVITSPPYWGLRDYGTGSWAGGDPDCDHQRHNARQPHERRTSTLGGGTDTIRVQEEANVYRDVCGKCGAQRTDQQHGMETTPDLYVANMVAVFREVRRALAPHGTCWVNIGDSYASSPPGGSGYNDGRSNRDERLSGGIPRGLKPKDLVGIPWRVAFALQADGWWLRSDIVWSKPNPMPESVTDRPTKAHEYVFLLTRQPRYWFDSEAVREPHNPKWLAAYEQHPKNPIASNPDSTVRTHSNGSTGGGMGYPSGGRNVRSVWEIVTQPYAEAHFATFPEELVRRCLLAGCPEWVCRVCRKPRERIVERASAPREVFTNRTRPNDGYVTGKRLGGEMLGAGQKLQAWRDEHPSETVGWSDCGHNDYRPGVVLDPFLGSGTTALVARKHGRHAVGIELSEDYAALAGKRLQQLSLLA